MKSPHFVNNTNNHDKPTNLKTKAKLSHNLANLSALENLSNNIIKTITTINGEVIKFVYSLPDKKVSAYVIEWKAGSPQGKAESDATKLTEELKKEPS